MPIFTDQIQRAVNITDFPQRIVSLVPSQTELLFDLGLENKIVGITKFCIHPKEKVKQIIKIGGTKNFNFERIDALNPDLIIGNKEENYQEGIEKLAARYPVWVSDIMDLEDALQMILEIGKITHTTTKAEEINSQIRKDFDELILNEPDRKLKLAYLIWRKPFMAVGNQTFIQTMLEQCDFENVFAPFNRYPEISFEQLQSANPEVILLSSEPYPFKEKHIAELQIICPDAKICLVDGEMFSWYGSRLLQAVAYFKNLKNSLQLTTFDKIKNS